MSTSEKAEAVPAISELDRIFLADTVLPSAKDAFCSEVSTLDKAIQNGDIVIDTNALLIPYGAGSESLTDIITSLNKLKEEKRLHLPAQVAREFIKNRPIKISELHQGLSDKLSKMFIPDKLAYPILDEINEYKEINKFLNEIVCKKKELIKKNKELLSKIRSWDWDDPVNKKYKALFTKDLIVDIEINKEEVRQDLLRRKELCIPPGYKDSTKSDLGIGDLLIWKTILYIGEKNKKDLIFISGEEKADWQHRSGNEGLLPRYELLDEYRRASDGKSFHIIPLSKLLELLSTKAATVDEIKKEEQRVHENTTLEVKCPHCDAMVTWKIAEFIGASAKPRCQNCDQLFHVHRTSDGFTVRKPYENQLKASELKREIVMCPICSNEEVVDLELRTNSTAWCKCGSCDELFPVHRKQDGTVKISRKSAT